MTLRIQVLAGALSQVMTTAGKMKAELRVIDLSSPKQLTEKGKRVAAPAQKAILKSVDLCTTTWTRRTRKTPEALS